MRRDSPKTLFICCKISRRLSLTSDVRVEGPFSIVTSPDSDLTIFAGMLKPSFTFSVRNYLVLELFPITTIVDWYTRFRLMTFDGFDENIIGDSRVSSIGSLGLPNTQITKLFPNFLRHREVTTVSRLCVGRESHQPLEKYRLDSTISLSIEIKTKMIVSRLRNKYRFSTNHIVSFVYDTVTFCGVAT